MLELETVVKSGSEISRRSC